MQGEIWLVPFPFNERAAITYKQRPVLIVGALDGHEGDSQPFLAAMITSNARRVNRPKPFDVPVASDAFTGLPLASVVRAARLWTAEARDLKLRLGVVPAATLDQVRRLIVDGYELA